VTRLQGIAAAMSTAADPAAGLSLSPTAPQPTSERISPCSLSLPLQPRAHALWVLLHHAQKLQRQRDDGRDEGLHLAQLQTDRQRERGGQGDGRGVGKGRGTGGQGRGAGEGRAGSVDRETGQRGGRSAQLKQCDTAGGVWTGAVSRGSSCIAEITACSRLGARTAAVCTGAASHCGIAVAVTTLSVKRVQPSQVPVATKQLHLHRKRTAATPPHSYQHSPIHSPLPQLPQSPLLQLRAAQASAHFALLAHAPSRPRTLQG